MLGYRDKQLILIIVLVNMLTNPFMNFIAILLIYLGLQEFFYYLILPLELLLIPVEWMILSYALPGRKKQLFVLSAVMNSFSFIIGLLVL